MSSSIVASARIFFMGDIVLSEVPSLTRIEPLIEEKFLRMEDVFSDSFIVNCFLNFMA
jgi:hypothetical protein